MKVPSRFLCQDRTPKPDCLYCRGPKICKEVNSHNGTLYYEDCDCWKQKYPLIDGKTIQDRIEDAGFKLCVALDTLENLGLTKEEVDAVLEGIS